VAARRFKKDKYIMAKTEIVSSMSPTVEVEPLKLTRKDLIDLVTSEMEESLDEEVKATDDEWNKRANSEKKGASRYLTLTSGKLFSSCSKAAAIGDARPLAEVKLDLRDSIHNTENKTVTAQYFFKENGVHVAEPGGYYDKVHLVLVEHLPAAATSLVKKARAHDKWVNEARLAHDQAYTARQNFNKQSKKVVQKLIRQELNSSAQGQEVLARIQQLKKTMTGGMKKLKG